MTPHFRGIGWLGVAVVGLSGVLLLVYPTHAPYLPGGFYTPILAFEFIETPQEVQQFFGPPLSPERAQMVRKMDWGNRLDFVYMLLYAAFLACFSVAYARHTQTRRVYGGALLALIVLVGDVLENIQLFRLTANLATGAFERELTALHWFTWQKWGGLALIFLLLASVLLQGQRWTRVIGIVGLLPAIFGILAYFNRSACNEWLALAVATMFLLLIVYCFLARPRSTSTK